MPQSGSGGQKEGGGRDERRDKRQIAEEGAENNTRSTSLSKTVTYSYKTMARCFLRTRVNKYASALGRVACRRSNMEQYVPCGD